MPKENEAFRSGSDSMVNLVATCNGEAAMENEWDGMRWTNLHGSLDEMEIISHGLFSVGVHIRSDPEFRAFMFAAGTAHALGNQSIDNTLRKYRAEWTERFAREKAEARRGITGLGTKIIEIVVGRCSELAQMQLPATAGYGEHAAVNAQIRLDSTFRAALVLIRLGHAFEAEAVIRQGLEQIAWTYGIRRLETIEQVLKTSGIGWITQLKDLYPGVGNFYGILSDYAHLAPRTHTRFVTASDQKVSISVRDAATAAQSMLALIALLDAFLIVSDECFQAYGIKCVSAEPANGELRPKRAAAKLISEFQDVLPARAAALFASWTTDQP